MLKIYLIFLISLLVLVAPVSAGVNYRWYDENQTAWVYNDVSQANYFSIQRLSITQNRTEMQEELNITAFVNYTLSCADIKPVWQKFKGNNNITGYDLYRDPNWDMNWVGFNPCGVSLQKGKSYHILGKLYKDNDWIFSILVKWGVAGLQIKELTWWNSSYDSQELFNVTGVSNSFQPVMIYTPINRSDVWVNYTNGTALAFGNFSGNTSSVWVVPQVNGTIAKLVNNSNAFATTSNMSNVSLFYDGFTSGSTPDTNLWSNIASLCNNVISGELRITISGDSTCMKSIKSFPAQGIVFYVDEYRVTDADDSLRFGLDDVFSNYYFQQNYTGFIEHRINSPEISTQSGKNNTGTENYIHFASTIQRAFRIYLYNISQHDYYVNDTRIKTHTTNIPATDMNIVIFGGEYGSSSTFSLDNFFIYNYTSPITVIYNKTENKINITSWSNNFTNNDTLSIVNSSINNLTVNFNLTSNPSSNTYIWVLNGDNQSWNYDNITLTFSTTLNNTINGSVCDGSGCDSKIWQVNFTKISDVMIKPILKNHSETTSSVILNSTTNTTYKWYWFFYKTNLSSNWTLWVNQSSNETTVTGLTSGEEYDAFVRVFNSTNVSIDSDVIYFQILASSADIALLIQKVNDLTALQRNETSAGAVTAPSFQSYLVLVAILFVFAKNRKKY